MLSAWDDLLTHQIVAPVRQVADDDPRWYDRYWFNIHSLDRRVVVSCGMGVYPNLDVIDGFAGIVYAGRQTNLRVSRTLGGDRSRTAVGPFSVDMVEGLRSLRPRLEENDRDIAFELEFAATAEPHARLPMMYLVRDGRVRNHTCHFNQPGRVRGWVRVGPDRFEVAPDSWWAVRDHSWGIRDGVGGPSHLESEPDASRDRPPSRWRPANPFVAAQFPGRYLFILGAGREGATGEIIPATGSPGGRIQIASAEIDVRIHPGTIRPAGAQATLVDDQGGRHTLTAEPWATFHLAGGGYGGFNGFWHGRPRGAYHEEGETWDLSDPDLIARIAGRDDHVCRFELDGEAGYGVLELGLRGGEPYESPESV